MGDLCKLQPPVSLVPARTHLPATPSRRINLRTRQDVHRELSRLYRDTRAGLVETQHATRLAYILSTISKTIGEIESSGRRSEKTYEDYLREAHETMTSEMVRKGPGRTIDE